MARKPVVRSLPSLASLFPHFAGFPPTENKSAAIVVKLRETIARVRSDRTVSFYSVRHVSQFFDVATKTVAQAYEKLEAEGLLTRVRGAQTLVQGRRLQPLHPVRGVVGLPVYLPGFVVGTTLRSYFTLLEAELRRYHFVADFIFYKAAEQGSPELAERLLEHELDLVLWQAPAGEVLPAMRRLLDGGIRQVVVADGKARFPCQQYFLDKERAYREAARAWLEDSIRSVIVLHPANDPTSHEFHLIADSLQRESMPFQAIKMADARLPRFVGEVQRRRDVGVVFVWHAWYESLCNQFPVAMERLFRARRVLLLQGPVYHPSFQGKSVLADAIDLPHEELARRIARDISTQRVHTAERLATFYTRYVPRVNLGRVSRGI